MRMSDGNRGRHTGEIPELYKVLDLYPMHNKIYLVG